MPTEDTQDHDDEETAEITDNEQDAMSPTLPEDAKGCIRRDDQKEDKDLAPLKSLSTARSMTTRKGKNMWCVLIQEHKD